MHLSDTLDALVGNAFEATGSAYRHEDGALRKVADTETGRLTVNVLGPLAAYRDGQPVEIRSTVQRDILGALAIQPGHPIPAGQLADILWAGRPPDTWRNLVHVHVNRLRARLEPGRPRRAPARTLVSIDGGYRLDLDADHSDLVAFERLVEQAAGTEDESRARRLYGEALARWRGPVLLGGNDQHATPKDMATALQRTPEGQAAVETQVMMPVLAWPAFTGTADAAPAAPMPEVYTGAVDGGTIGPFTEWERPVLQP